MIRIGIVGAENSHSAAIARTLNVDRAVAGCRVVAIWGETAEFAEKAAQAGEIPAVVDKPAEMIGDIDGVVIDHRHPKHHLPAAEAFIDARVPMFIDKPFCYRLSAGKAFLARARRMGVPVTGYSSVPTQKHFGRFVGKVRRGGPVVAAGTVGPVDLASPYGGIFFYGIHQVDMLLEAFGTDVSAVGVDAGGKAGHAVASLFFASGLVATMHCLKDAACGFQIFAVTDAGPAAAKIRNDANPYLNSTRRFCKMFATGVEPVDHRRILAPIPVLEAMETSIKTGKVTPVAKV